MKHILLSVFIICCSYCIYGQNVSTNDLNEIYSLFKDDNWEKCSSLTIKCMQQLTNSDEDNKIKSKLIFFHMFSEIGKMSKRLTTAAQLKEDINQYNGQNITFPPFIIYTKYKSEMNSYYINKDKPTGLSMVLGDSSQIYIIGAIAIHLDNTNININTIENKPMICTGIIKEFYIFESRPSPFIIEINEGKIYEPND